MIVLGTLMVSLGYAAWRGRGPLVGEDKRNWYRYHPGFFAMPFIFVAGLAWLAFTALAFGIYERRESLISLGGLLFVAFGAFGWAIKSRGREPGGWFGYFSGSFRFPYAFVFFLSLCVVLISLISLLLR